MKPPNWPQLGKNRPKPKAKHIGIQTHIFNIPPFGDATELIRAGMSRKAFALHNHSRIRAARPFRARGTNHYSAHITQVAESSFRRVAVRHANAREPRREAHVDVVALLLGGEAHDELAPHRPHHEHAVDLTGRRRVTAGSHDTRASVARRPRVDVMSRCAVSSHRTLTHPPRSAWATAERQMAETPHHRFASNGTPPSSTRPSCLIPSLRTQPPNGRRTTPYPHVVRRRTPRVCSTGNKRGETG